MQMSRKFLAALLLVLSATATAQVQYSKGRGTVTYTEPAVTPAVKLKANQAAEVKAIESYYAEAGESESNNFEAIRDKVTADLDHYILESVMVSEEDRPDVKQYSVTVRVKLNLAALRTAVKSASAVGNVDKSAKSALTFLFIARQVSSQTVFDARTYQRTDVKATGAASQSVSQIGAEGESVSKSQVSTNASKSTAVAAAAAGSVSVEHGGSTTQKASESTWSIFPSSNLNSVFTGAFGTAGYKVQEASLVEPYTNGKLRIAAVQDDYKSGMDLKPQTLKNVVDGIRIAQGRYLALGTLDVGLPDKDPATGLMRVSVTVNAKVLDVTPMIPENVATVGPVVYSGLGPSEGEAQTNALKVAAQSASRELISQLTNAGLH